jgi:hypothetical protein
VGIYGSFLQRLRNGLKSGLKPWRIGVDGKNRRTPSGTLATLRKTRKSKGVPSQFMHTVADVSVAWNNAKVRITVALIDVCTVAGKSEMPPIAFVEIV